MDMPCLIRITIDGEPHDTPIRGKHRARTGEVASDEPVVVAFTRGGHCEVLVTAADNDTAVLARQVIGPVEVGQQLAFNPFPPVNAPGPIVPLLNEVAARQYRARVDYLEADGSELTPEQIDMVRLDTADEIVAGAEAVAVDLRKGVADRRAERARKVDRPPYVGEGADGARRSAQIDREEADGLAAEDPRREELLTSATRWDEQAARHG